MKQEGREEEGRKLAFDGILDLDTARNYVGSIQVLQRMLEHDQSDIQKSKIISHILIRYLLLGETDEIENYTTMLKELPKSSLAEMALQVKEYREQSIESEFILDSIEYQNVFGKFEPLDDIPYLEFNDENAVHIAIEDFFSNGRYIANLIQSSTNFHHAVDVDVGTAIDVNIVEKKRLMKLE